MDVVCVCGEPLGSLGGLVFSPPGGSERGGGGVPVVKWHVGVDCGCWEALMLWRDAAATPTSGWTSARSPNAATAATAALTNIGTNP